MNEKLINYLNDELVKHSYTKIKYLEEGIVPNSDNIFFDLFVLLTIKTLKNIEILNPSQRNKIYNITNKLLIYGRQ